MCDSTDAGGIPHFWWNVLVYICYLGRFRLSSMREVVPGKEVSGS